MLAYALMFVVFLMELRNYLVSSYSSFLKLDPRDDDLIQINFNIDLYDIECRNVRVAVFDQFGEESLNLVAADFYLRAVDSKGRTFGMATKPQGIEEDSELGHARRMAELAKEDGKTELDADWASSHDGFKHQSFEHVIQAHDFTLINFFAEWCSHCRDFSPRWNALAKQINGQEGERFKEFPDRDGVPRRVLLIKMNCVDFQKLCNEKGIDAYPTMRLYKADGSFSVFEGKRDDTEIMRWIEKSVRMKSYGWAKNHEAFERGCNANGRLQVPRVPGHLEMMAGGGDQNLNPSMTNVSHLIKHLSFSDPDDGKYHRKGWSGLPTGVMDHVTPLDGKTFATERYHEAWVHDMKVVSTISQRGQTVYQFAHVPRLSRLEADQIPQAQFFYDIEPFSIQFQKESKKWYDFATSTLAILGGIYVTMRLMSKASQVAASSVASKFSPSKQPGGHMNIGHYD